jgi:hypothetical protein
MDSTPAFWPRYGLWCALAVFVVTRVLIMIVACTAPQDRSSARTGLWWSSVPTARWDAGHYSIILRSGYPLVNGRLPGPPTSDTIAFFPGYPLLARPLTYWLGPDAALVVLTHIAALVGTIFFYLWARRRYDDRIAFWGVTLLSTYPAAMFFSSGYAEGLMVCWVALILWLLDHQRLWTAALVTGLSTATRPTGLCVGLIVVLWVLLYGPRRMRLARAAGVGLLCVSGIIAFQLHLWQHYGRPDAFVAVQSAWETQKEPENKALTLLTFKSVIQPATRPLKDSARGLTHLALGHTDQAKKYFQRLLTPEDWNPFISLTIVVLGVVGLIRPGRLPRILYLLPILVFLEGYLPDPYRGGRLIGIARYQLISLPAFLLLASWLAGLRVQWPRYALCLGMLGLQCIYVRRFVNWILVS